MTAQAMLLLLPCEVHAVSFKLLGLCCSSPFDSKLQATCKKQQQQQHTW
jgi:hypothetical protein